MIIICALKHDHFGAITPDDKTLPATGRSDAQIFPLLQRVSGYFPPVSIYISHSGILYTFALIVPTRISGLLQLLRPRNVP